MKHISVHWFCILQLYWIYWSVFFVFFLVFLVESLRFSIYSIISCENSDSFISSLPVWVSFISLCCLIFVARTSHTMLNKSGEGEHPYFLPDLRENHCIFSHWVWCWLWVFYMRLLLHWGVFPLNVLYWWFSSWMDVVLCQILFCIY